MSRPYIFCHMMTSLDGKIMGDYMETPEGEQAGRFFKTSPSESLTGKASNAYKAFLRRLGISYIIAGETGLDYGLAMEKLKVLFHIETLMLGGGGVLNWSFIQAGMCDEISIVIAAAADGSTDTPALFSAKGNFAPSKALGFRLENAEVKDGGSVWLRYKMNQEGANAK